LTTTTKKLSKKALTSTIFNTAASIHKWQLNLTHLCLCMLKNCANLTT